VVYKELGGWLFEILGGVKREGVEPLRGFRGSEKKD